MSTLIRFIRRIGICDVPFAKLSLLEDLLNKCTSLQILVASCIDRPSAENLKLTIQSDTLQELTILAVSFDFSGCPNLKKVEFNNYYADVLEGLQKLEMKEMAFVNLAILSHTDDRTLDVLKIPHSVRRLSLRGEWQWPKSIPSCLKPYTITLPTAMEKLEICDAAVLLSNIQEVE
ncbi:unnamed protein product [Ambrosiozyma monospora]|uniref:Unnamed protein product n=1 Tax=Ambrosiozyma monospora TaxID=43982 RepID=A0ACB5STL3_AMBMO|nr:unnamed protein product [Ambrosiozyma monospora]